MNRISILPLWTLNEHDERRQSFPKLLALLAAIRDKGNLIKACRATGVSYRYAWGMIKDGAQIFGAPLVTLARGQGATLTALGEKLVWADKRIAARLSPILESLAAELEGEIGRVLAASQTVPRIHASYSYSVSAVREFLLQRNTRVDLRFRGSLESLASLCQSECEIAGFHVPTGELESPMLLQYAKWLKPRGQKLIHLVLRRQGLMVARGNPKRVVALADLAGPGVRFVNRQYGSGTRMLLDLLLKRGSVDPRRILGYDSAEFTHAAIAAFVASGMADAGFGVEAAARKFDLDFVPLVTERYFLACHNDALGSPFVAAVIDVLLSREFKSYISNFSGLDAIASGTIMTIDEAFPEFRRARRSGAAKNTQRSRSAENLPAPAPALPARR